MTDQYSDNQTNQYYTEGTYDYTVEDANSNTSPCDGNCGETGNLLDCSICYRDHQDTIHPEGNIDDE